MTGCEITTFLIREPAHLVGKSEARRAYSQDFWGLEVVTQTPGSY